MSGLHLLLTIRTSLSVGVLKGFTPENFPLNISSPLFFLLFSFGLLALSRWAFWVDPLIISFLPIAYLFAFANLLLDFLDFIFQLFHY